MASAPAHNAGLAAVAVLTPKILVGGRSAVSAISAERPSYRNGGVEAVRTRGAKIGRTKRTSVAAQVINLMLSQAQL